MAEIAAFIGAVLVVLAGFAGLMINRRGHRIDALKRKVEDHETADDIRGRVDRADERVRRFDDAGWRD